MNITVIARGHVGGGLARRWRQAGHVVRERIRDGLPIRPDGSIHRFAGHERARRAIEAHREELFCATPQGYVPAWRPPSRTVLITRQKSDRTG